MFMMREVSPPEHLPERERERKRERERERERERDAYLNFAVFY